MLEFFKYQGTGNDFIIIDNRKKVFDPNNDEWVIKLCDRKFGIGADGLILIQQREGYDFEMIYYNADASKSLCGNGCRCAVSFAKLLGIIDDKAHFMAIDGPHFAHIKDDLVHLKMSDVMGIEQHNEDGFVHNGSPHHICYVNDLDSYPVYEQGKFIRNNDRYQKEGTNVNFVEVIDEQNLFVRTYERGVENETLSCGTGVTASSLFASMKGMESPIYIKTLGGDLTVSFEKKENNLFENIYLIGPAQMIYKGMIQIDNI